MRILTVLFCFIYTVSFAQIKGNKEVETRIFPFERVTTIKVNLYADVVIDAAATAGLEITAESNLIDYIDREIIDGTVDLSQLKWIQPTEQIRIRIGAPILERVVHDTHDSTTIINIDNESLRINASIGKVYVQGKTQKLRLGAETGRIYAADIKAQKAYVNLWSGGMIWVNPIQYLWADVSDGGRLIYTNLPTENKVKTRDGGSVVQKGDKVITRQKEVQWISFKIKNNSWNRHNFVVKGPKADGSYFGYGFPMMPQAKRKERWSVGSKIYKENKLGFRKLLVTIKAEDEGQIVDLFP